MEYQTPKNLSARYIAWKVLTELEQGSFRHHADEKLEKMCKRQNLSIVDRNLAFEIISGCLRNKTLLEFYLSGYSSQEVSRIELGLRWILILSFYQLIFLDKIPDHAIVNEAVNLCKQENQIGWSKFVNGILRSALRDNVKEKELPKMSATTAYSHPSWLINSWRKSFGDEKTINILKWNNNVPQQFAAILRNFDQTINELVPSIAELSDEFEQRILKIKDFKNLFKSNSFKNGDIYLMTPWSISITQKLPLQSNLEILDMCSAPGGKAILTSCLDGVKITAMDNSSRRIEKLKENLMRCKIKNVTPVIGDGRDSLKIFGKEKFDAVLLDAPCSSLGVIQRHPEIRWRVTSESFISIQILQKQLLGAAIEATKPGGHILYSVCTFSYEETDEIINIFLSENKNMCCLKKELNLPSEKNMCGGFFALLKKRSSLPSHRL